MQDEISFELPFEEQRLRQEAETPAAIEFDSADLPRTLFQIDRFQPFCFAYPDPEICDESPAQLLTQLQWMPDSAKRAAAILVDYADEDQLKGRLLGGLSSSGAEAIARIMAILLCAEESAINVFTHEGKRLEEKQMQASRQAMMEIASEERVHNWLLQKARTMFPVTEDMASIRRRTRRLFMRVASRDLATHFARISGLDSGVCICLTALLGSELVTRVEGVAQLFRHIRRDESTHVKKSRAHALDLGFPSSLYHEAYELTRSGMVGMLTPIAESFEIMGVDPDRLFKRLVRYSLGKTVETA